MAQSGFHTVPLSSHHVWKQRVMHVPQSCASLYLESHFSILIVMWCYCLLTWHNNKEVTISVIEMVQPHHKHCAAISDTPRTVCRARLIFFRSPVISSSSCDIRAAKDPLREFCFCTGSPGLKGSEPAFPGVSDKGLDRIIFPLNVSSHVTTSTKNFQIFL